MHSQHAVGHKAYTISMRQTNVCARPVMCWCSTSGNHSKPHPGAKVVFRGLRVWRHHQNIVPKLCMQQIID